jgi:hypothetical protein
MFQSRPKEVQGSLLTTSACPYPASIAYEILKPGEWTGCVSMQANTPVLVR